jgi:hypothetical protein
MEKDIKITEKEKEWILNMIHEVLSSFHDTRGTTRDEYDRHNNILGKGITEEICQRTN